ncbi:hypothetical protein HMPREF9096_01798 [Haemophilus sp. oral taxon 851 str. F0397]|nr:hypothetical protein HMPREF9096_01798 [Haemophilus sp. oral taxon 851 str. F0397]
MKRGLFYNSPSQSMAQCLFFENNIWKIAGSPAIFFLLTLI